MSTKEFQLLIVWTLICVNSYYLSPNRYDWIQAQQFCINHCNSSLASIHNTDDIKLINTIANKSYKYPSFGNKNIWIGLNASKWIDTTPFDFSKLPWDDSPDISGYAAYTLSNITNEYVLINQHYSIASRVLCNHCDAILNKYIFNDIHLSNFSSAEMYCQSELQTHLASIHSLRDQYEIQTILNTANIARDAYMGLSDEITDWIFLWNDNSTFDFGKTFYIIPWKGDEPNNAGNQEKCVLLWQSDSWNWNDAECVAQNPFVCNLRSELCDDKYTLWNIINGNITQHTCDSFVINDFHGFISNKQWVNNNKILVIDYLFAVNNDSVSIGSTMVGVVLYNFNSSHNYYVFGILKTVDDWNVFLATNIDHEFNYVLLGSIFDSFNYSVYYTLKIEIKNGNSFKIMINNVTLTHVEQDGVVGMDSVMSGYIGLISVNSTVTAKSLFVSGSVRFLDAVAETTQPPTSLPVIVIYYGVIVVISFEYELSNNTNITNDNINEILISIIEADTFDTNICTDDYDIKITNYNENRILINSTVYTCDAESQNILLAKFNVSLEKEFIEQVTTKLNVKTVSVDIDVNVINKNVLPLSTISELLYTTSNDEIQNHNSEMLWIIIICVLVAIILLFGCCFLIFKIQKIAKNKRVKMQIELEQFQTDDNQINQNHITPLESAGMSNSSDIDDNNETFNNTLQKNITQTNIGSYNQDLNETDDELYETKNTETIGVGNTNTGTDTAGMEQTAGQV